MTPPDTWVQIFQQVTQLLDRANEFRNLTLELGDPKSPIYGMPPEATERAAHLVHAEITQLCTTIHKLMETIPQPK